MKHVIPLLLTVLSACGGTEPRPSGPGPADGGSDITARNDAGTVTAACTGMISAEFYETPKAAEEYSCEVSYLLVNLVPALRIQLDRPGDTWVVSAPDLRQVSPDALAPLNKQNGTGRLWIEVSHRGRVGSSTSMSGFYGAQDMVTEEGHVQLGWKAPIAKGSPVTVAFAGLLFTGTEVFPGDRPSYHVEAHLALTVTSAAAH